MSSNVRDLRSFDNNDLPMWMNGKGEVEVEGTLVYNGVVMNTVFSNCREDRGVPAFRSDAGSLVRMVHTVMMNVFNHHVQGAGVDPRAVEFVLDTRRDQVEIVYNSMKIDGNDVALDFEWRGNRCRTVSDVMCLLYHDILYAEHQTGVTVSPEVRLTARDRRRDDPGYPYYNRRLGFDESYENEDPFLQNSRDWGRSSDLMRMERRERPPWD